MAITVDEDHSLAPDSASALGVALLGQLVRHLKEARFVLDFVAGEIDLDLVDTCSALASMTVAATDAFEAASLLQREAALEDRWGQRASRPVAIFARHRAAVRNGAAPVEPATVPQLIHPSMPSLSQDERPVKPPVRFRPVCGHSTKSTGEPCRNPVVVLEDAVLATGCAIHLPAVERSSFLRQRAQTDAWYVAVESELAAAVGKTANDAAGLWLARQSAEFQIPWDEFCNELGIIRPATVDPAESSPADTRSDHIRAEGPCADCEGLVVDQMARVSVGLEQLVTWAAHQATPRWAGRSTPPQEWIFEAPVKALASPGELNMYLATNMFLDVVTEPAHLASAVAQRHEGILDMLLGQAVHVDSILPPAARQSSATNLQSPTATTTARRPERKQPRKKRQKR